MSQKSDLSDEHFEFLTDLTLFLKTSQLPQTQSKIEWYKKAKDIHGPKIAALILDLFELGVSPEAAKKWKIDLLLITVNEYETQAIQNVFQNETGTPAKPLTIDERVYHNLGTINGTTIFHAISEMGSGSVGAMQQTVNKAILSLDPSAIIAVGIAFGINPAKQKIGDVLVSKQLRLYDLQRVGEKIILRDDKPHSSSWLINFFEVYSQTTPKRSIKVRFGVLLSGEKLIDNINYRDQLLQFESEAIGGEMEGKGLYVSAQDHKKDWIVIKAICDWADGEKNKNKKKRQMKAAQNAAQFLLSALQYASLRKIK